MKKRGFIRWKGFIPFVIITVLVYVIATYFIDGWIKKAIEKNGTRLNGALVEMKSLRLSFVNSSLKIKAVQVTNPNNLMQNRFEVGDITFDFRFLPLLKKKFVVEEVKVAEVKWLSPRSREGKIPASWAREWAAEEKEESVLGPLVAQAFENLKNSVKAELPDISVDSLKKKFDPREAIKLIDLTSYKTAFELKDKAVASYAKWGEDSKKFIDEQKNFVSNMKTKLASLNPNNLKTPDAIINSISTVSSFDNDLKSAKSGITGRLDGAKADLASLTSPLKNIPDLIKADVKGIVDKYSLGSLNLDNFSKNIFGMQWLPYYQKYVEYSVVAKKYMAKYQAGKDDEPKRERFKGMDIRFPITDGTPTLLVKKVDMSAETGKDEKSNDFYRGKYALHIQDISSDQRLYGKPIKADFSLDTFNGPFVSAIINLLLDYRDEPEINKADLTVNDFKLTDYTLAKGSAFPLPLKEGVMDIAVSAGLSGEKPNFGVKLDVNSATYNFIKSQNYVLELLQNIVSRINKFWVKIAFEGTLRDPKFTVNSSLDNAIAAGIKQVFAEKMAEVRLKAEAYIKAEVGKYLDQAKGQIAQLEGNVTKQLEDQLKNVDFLSGDVKKKIDELKKKQQSLVTDKIQSQIGSSKETQDAKKKIKGLFGK
jgi:uncharacterized protein (TIGR03545 family)